MGQVLSSCSHADNKNEKDWMYVQAIREPQHLDWKNHIQDGETRKDIVQKQRQPPVAIIDDYLYQSGATGMLDKDRLKTLGITHVLNVAGQGAGSLEDDKYRKLGITYKSIAASDREGYPMFENHLDECRSYISSCRKSGGKCVVHCQAGANRSGIIVAAEFMLTKRMTVLEVIYHCRKQRGNVFLCNASFQRELVSLARSEGLLGPKPGHPGCIVEARMKKPG